MPATTTFGVTEYVFPSVGRIASTSGTVIATSTVLLTYEKVPSRSVPSVTRKPLGTENDTWMSTSGCSARDTNGRAILSVREAVLTAVAGTRAPAPRAVRSQVAWRPPGATGQSPVRSNR